MNSENQKNYKPTKKETKEFVETMQKRFNQVNQMGKLEADIELQLGLEKLIKEYNFERNPLDNAKKRFEADVDDARAIYIGTATNEGYKLAEKIILRTAKLDLQSRVVILNDYFGSIQRTIENISSKKNHRLLIIMPAKYLQDKKVYDALRTGSLKTCSFIEK